MFYEVKIILRHTMERKKFRPIVGVLGTPTISQIEVFGHGGICFPRLFTE